MGREAKTWTEQTRRRVIQSPRAAAHRKKVEVAAVTFDRAALRKARFNVISTEDRRKVGSDLWARAVEGDGNVLDGL